MGKNQSVYDKTVSINKQKGTFIFSNSYKAFVELKSYFHDIDELKEKSNLSNIRQYISQLDNKTKAQLKKNHSLVRKNASKLFELFEAIAKSYSSFFKIMKNKIAKTPVLFFQVKTAKAINFHLKNFTEAFIALTYLNESPLNKVQKVKNELTFEAPPKQQCSQRITC